MRLIKNINDVQKELQKYSSTGLVPTMGNIHEGHLSLIRLAKKSSSFVICSIFVNPLQFTDHLDFAKYPRTLKSDMEKLEKAGTDLVFFPDYNEIYPKKQEFFVEVPPYLGDSLEGKFREKFFSSVSTIVLKLLMITNPTIIFFGKKDYQQAFVVRKLCEQFCLRCKFVHGNTVRSNDGLALSSRNSYLSRKEKSRAPELYHHLCSAKVELTTALMSESLDSEILAEIERKHQMELIKKGWRVDYFTILNKQTFRTPKKVIAEYDTLIILAAAWLGDTRLIDNLEII